MWNHESQATAIQICQVWHTAYEALKPPVTMDLYKAGVVVVEDGPLQSYEMLWQTSEEMKEKMRNEIRSKLREEALKDLRSEALEDVRCKFQSSAFREIHINVRKRQQWSLLNVMFHIYIYL